MQIYVEIERARLTRQLAAIQEEKGDISAAADTLQEVAVVSFEPLNTPNCSQDCGRLTRCSSEFSKPMPEGLQSGLWGLCMLTCGCYLGCQGSNVTLGSQEHERLSTPTCWSLHVQRCRPGSALGNRQLRFTIAHGWLQATSHTCAGDVWSHGKDREDRLHPGASAAVPGAQGLHQVWLHSHWLPAWATVCCQVSEPV